VNSGSRIDAFGKEKRQLPMPGFEPQCLDLLVCRLVTIPAEVYQIRHLSD
jgi:hypothetical protein